MPRNTESFLLGTGVAPETHVCSECGFEHAKKKLFKKNGDTGLTCATGHYEDREGNLKRARNPYARH
jgi:hypothetical protein